MSKMKFYNNSQSRGVILLILFEELDILSDVDIIELGYGYDMKSKEFKKINPLGKVPVLVDNTITIVETPAIIAYLTDKYIDKGLAPSFTDPRRGLYYKWLFFTHGPLVEFVDFTRVGFSYEQVNKHVRSLSCGDEVELYNFLKISLTNANPYLCGENFTSADLYFSLWLAYSIVNKNIQLCEEFLPYLKLIQKRNSMQKIEWLQSIM